MPYCFCIPKKIRNNTKDNQDNIKDDEWSDDEIDPKKENKFCIIC